MKKEFFDLAEEMEKECGDWENSEGLSQAAKSALVTKVQQMDRQAGKKPFCLKKRYLVVLAAALVLVMGMGVVGDRAWISDSTDLERESEVTTKVDNEEKEDILLEEEAIYQEIAERLGIVPMRLGYIPKGMKLDSYTLRESSGWVNVNYLYRENLISVQMGKLSEEASGNVQWDGVSRKLENVPNELGYEIEAYCVDEEHQNYAANLTYGNGYYSIFGVFGSEEEFLEILYGIYFKNL